MVIVSGLMHVRPEKQEEALQIARRMEEAARREPGCLEYGIYTSASDPNAFFIYEEWASETALTAHFTTPHMREFQTALPLLWEGATSVRFYRRHDVTHSETL